MIRFYYNLSPNPMKIALALEETGLDYQPLPIDARTGDQFAPDYLAVNPNAKVPAIDDDGVLVFDSNAILLYLARKTGRFSGPPTAQGQADLLSWLMFVATGIGPYSGQAVHFRHMAAGTSEYAHRRYQFEADRHYKVLDGRLEGRKWILGGDYSIVDMGAWGWIRMADFVMGDGALDRFPNVARWFADVNARPAARRTDALKTRHAFKTEWDKDARGNMFRFLTEDEK